MSIERVKDKNTERIGRYVYYALDEFATSDDLENYKKEDYTFYYKVAKTISNDLKIKCPDIGLHYGQMQLPDGTELGGFLIRANDRILSPNKDLALISMENCKENEKCIVGVLAHELRHTWQNTYNYDLSKDVAVGFYKSLDNSAEIDADGYAILYLSHAYNMTLEDAASIICPTENAEYLNAYRIRLSRAKEIQAEKSNKRSLRDSLKNLFFK